MLTTNIPIIIKKVLMAEIKRIRKTYGGSTTIYYESDCNSILIYSSLSSPAWDLKTLKNNINLKIDEYNKTAKPENRISNLAKISLFHRNECKLNYVRINPEDEDKLKLLEQIYIDVYNKEKEEHFREYGELLQYFVDKYGHSILDNMCKNSKEEPLYFAF